MKNDSLQWQEKLKQARETGIPEYIKALADRVEAIAADRGAVDMIDIHRLTLGGIRVFDEVALVLELIDRGYDVVIRQSGLNFELELERRTIEGDGDGSEA